MIKRLVKHYKLQIIFALISLAYGSMYLCFLKQGLGGDDFFHYLSFKDIYLSLSQGAWPQFNLHTGYILGSATNTFYPWLIFSPLIPLIPLLTPFHWWGLAISIGLLCGLDITTWVGYKWFHSVKAGIWLALFYCLSTIPFSEIYGQGDLSAFYAMMIAPLALYGWREWLLYNKWRLLTISISLLVYTHVLTALIVIVSLGLLTCMQIFSLSRTKIWAGIKSILYGLSLTSVYWVPMLILHFTNHIFTPAGHGLTYMNSQRPILDITNIIAPFSANIWSIITIASILVVLICHRYLSYESWCYFDLSILFLILNNYFLCSWLMTHTCLNVLQFTHRICFITIFYFSFILVKLGQRKLIPFKRYAVPVILLTTIMLIVGFSQKVHLINQMPNLTSTVRAWHSYGTPLPYTKSELNSVSSLRALPRRYPDYYPYSVASQSKLTRIPITHQKEYVPILRNIPQKNIRITSNQLIIRSNYPRTITLPVVTYHQQTYQVLNNNHVVKWYPHKSLITCHVRHGLNHIQVHSPVMWYRYVTMIVSVIAALMLLLRRRKI